MKSEGFETVSIQLCTGSSVDIIDDPVTVEIEKVIKVHTLA